MSYVRLTYSVWTTTRADKHIQDFKTSPLIDDNKYSGKNKNMSNYKLTSFYIYKKFETTLFNHMPLYEQIVGWKWENISMKIYHHIFKNNYLFKVQEFSYFLHYVQLTNGFVSHTLQCWFWAFRLWKIISTRICKIEFL